MAVFFALSFLWHRLFHIQLATDSYRGDSFRPTMYDSWAPFYIWPMPWKALNGWVCLFALAVAVLLAFYYERMAAWRWVVLVPCIMWLVFSILFAASDHPDRVSGVYAHYLTFANDLIYFSSPSDIWHHYIGNQPKLDVHGQHYPPGYLFLLMISGVKTFRVITYLAGILTIGITWKLANEIYDRKTATAASFFIALVPGFLIYPTLDPVVLATCCAVSGFYCLHRLTRQSSFLFAALFSCCSFVFLLFSFAASLWVLFAAIFFGLNRKNVSWLIFLKQLSLASGILFLLFTGLYLITGFDMYDCFIGSLHRNKAINTFNVFDTLPRFLFRISQVYFGVILSCLPLFIFSAFPGSKWWMSFGLTLLITFLTGNIFGETERVFVFLFPFAAISTAFYLTQNNFKTGLALGFSVVFSAFFEVLFHHFA